MDNIEVGPVPDIVPASSEDGDEGVQSETDPQASNPDSEPDSEEESEAKPVPTLLNRSLGKKGPAWVDPDAPDVQVSLAPNKRLRTLRTPPLRMRLVAVSTDDISVGNSKTQPRFPMGFGREEETVYC